MKHKTKNQGGNKMKDYINKYKLNKLKSNLIIIYRDQILENMIKLKKGKKTILGIKKEIWYQIGSALDNQYTSYGGIQGVSLEQHPETFRKICESPGKKQ